jgi:hypothetical protein
MPVVGAGETGFSEISPRHVQNTPRAIALALTLSIESFIPGWVCLVGFGVGDSSEAWDSAFPNLQHESEGGHFPSRLSLSLRHSSRFSDPHVDPAGYAERMSVVIVDECRGRSDRSCRTGNDRWRIDDHRSAVDLL